MWLIKNRYLEPDPNYISQILQELINKASLQHKKKIKLNYEEYRTMLKRKLGHKFESNVYIFPMMGWKRRK